MAVINDRPGVSPERETLSVEKTDLYLGDGFEVRWLLRRAVSARRMWNLSRTVVASVLQASGISRVDSRGESIPQVKGKR